MNRLAPFVACLLVCGTASADPAAGGDRARAEKLFREGSEALEKGRTDEACTKLAESAALYRALGTEYNLGTCFEVSHRTASAKRAYLRAAAIAHQSGKESIAKDAYARARKMDAATPKLVVTAPTDAGAVTILCDGIPVVAGDTIELDPGAHLVKATAPGRAPYDARVDLAEGRTTALAVTLAPATDPVTPTSPVAKGETSAAKKKDGVDRATVIGASVGAAGVVALGIGIGFAFVAKGERDDAGCEDGRRCPDRAAADRLSSAKSDANVATALFVVGGVLAAAGAVLAFADPFEWRARRTSAVHLVPAVAPGVAALRFSMGW